MAEYITKEQAKEVFINYMGATSVATGILAGCLYDKIPPAEVVERKKAKWIKPKGMMPPEFHGYYACSNCNEWALMRFRMVPRGQELSEFCPHCGSRMENGNEADS